VCVCVCVSVSVRDSAVKTSHHDLLSFAAHSILVFSSTRGWKQRGVPLLVTHGTQDPTLPAGAVAAQVQTVQAFLTLSKVQFHTYPKADSRISSADEARDFFAFFAPLFASRLAAMEVGVLGRDSARVMRTSCTHCPASSFRISCWPPSCLLSWLFVFAEHPHRMILTHSRPSGSRQGWDLDRAHAKEINSQATSVYSTPYTREPLVSTSLLKTGFP
jgi:hypothetical protein